MDIDVQGVKSMKKTTFNSNYIFVCTPSLEVLEERLKGRGTETEESLKKRLELAKADMEYGKAEGNGNQQNTIGIIENTRKARETNGNKINHRLSCGFSWSQVCLRVF